MKCISMISLTLVLSALLLPNMLSAQMDDRTPEEKAYEFRDSLFNTIGWKMGKLVGAKMQGDKAAFQKEAADMAYLSGLIVEGFELKDSIPEGSLAKPEIWSDWDTFVEKANDLQTSAQDLADSGDMGAFDPMKFGRGNCGVCHKDFKERDE